MRAFLPEGQLSSLWKYLPKLGRGIRCSSERVALFLRNGLFARHGRPFSGSRTRRFFNRRSWYSVDPHFAESRLNAVEICNAYFLKERYPGLPVGSWGRGIRLVLDPQLPVGNLGICSVTTSTLLVWELSAMMRQ